jgi:hypothetical protein
MLQSSYRFRKRIRLGLVLLGLPQLAIGIWALLFPRNFFEEFPFGRAWVSELGPFNEHLTTDVGALFCAIGLIALLAAPRIERRLSQVVAVGWIVFVGPHLFFHATHTRSFSALDNLLQLGALVLQLLVALYVIALARRLKS